MTTPDFQFLRTEPVDLKRYLPVFLYLSPEFKAIQTALEKEHERQRQVQIDVAKQMKAETATWGMASWERMLGINVDTSINLETRRASVLAKMGKPSTVTPAFLTRMINLFTSVAATQIVEHPESYTIDIYLPDSGTHDFTLIDNAVATYLPAHLGHTYHFKTHLDASEYIGTVIRMASRGVECGLLANDEVLQTAVLWSVDTPVFEIKDDAIHLTELGLKANPVWNANTSTVSPAAAAPVGATDGIFYVSGDGSVKQKVGAPATFTRASTAVLGGRTYQSHEPRFMDNGLLCEPATTNLAASVIDVTNASLNGWALHQMIGTAETSSALSYSHERSIHLANGGDRYDKNRISAQNYKMTIGKTYTFSCMVYLVSGSFLAYTTEDVEPYNLNTYSNKITTVGEWTKLAFTVKITKASTTSFFLECGKGSEVYVDDIQLEARPYATSFTPTSRDAREWLTIAEWVVNKPAWTCEFDLTYNDKMANYECTALFGMPGWKADTPYQKSWRLEGDGENNLKILGDLANPVTKAGFSAENPTRITLTWNEGKVVYYCNGVPVGQSQESSGEKVLSSIIIGNISISTFNGCVKNFRFSSTVHTAEKIAADSKLDALPVEDDTVLYIPLKEDLSMYGHYND